MARRILAPIAAFYLENMLAPKGASTKGAKIP